MNEYSEIFLFVQLVSMLLFVIGLVTGLWSEIYIELTFQFSKKNEAVNKTD